MEYGRIIKRAWHVTWRNKVLWIFGIAAALFGAGASHGGGGGSSGQGAQFVVNLPGMQGSPRGRHIQPFIEPGYGFRPPDWGFVRPMMPRVLPVIGVIVAILAVIGLIAFVVGLIVRYTSYGSMIGMVGEIEDEEKSSFKSGLAIGWKRLLHLLATDIVVGIAVFVVMMVAMLAIAIVAGLPLIPGIIMMASGKALGVVGIMLIIIGALIAGLLLILVGLALSAAGSLIRDYAYRASVLDSAGVFEGIKQAIALCKSRTRESLLMWILMFVIELGLGILTIPLALLAAAIMIGPAAIAMSAGVSIGASLLTAVPGLIIVGLISAVVGGIYLVFKSATWTLTYRELQSIDNLAA